MSPMSIPELEARYLVPTYRRPPVVFTRGAGCYLFDEEEKTYLDFAAGIAVTALGHSDPGWAAAVAEQAGTLTHVSNLFHTRPHVALAQRLVEHSFADRVFFTNSGTEANEAAFKFARKWARLNHSEEKSQVVAFQGSFHGRSMGSLSLTAKEKYRQPFAPLIPGVSFVPFNDLAAAAAAINAQTCAVFVEPIQGEGGVHPADPGFLRGLRELCDQHQALLVFDEVQCGLGRSGHLWAHQAFGVAPDMMSLAKPLAGGLPIGALLVSERVSAALEPGDHGSTFAGGPLVCRAAEVVFERVANPDFLARVTQLGKVLMEAAGGLPGNHIVALRGMGLLIGIELDVPVQPIMRAALDNGLIVINAGENVLRICPPLTISETEIERGIQILALCLRALEQ